jgi:ABC-type uncharacterized transport system involved in gliding motility auxiliary subunit
MAPRAPILGIAGLVLIGFGLLAHWMTYNPAASIFSFGWFALIHLAGGVIAMVAYLSSGSGSLLDFVRRRSTRYGVNAALYSVMFLAVISMANFLGTRYHTRFDLSVQQVNSLSEQSLAVVQALDSDLQIDAFIETGSDPVVEELLTAYRYASDRIRYRMIDPQVSPTLAQAAGIAQVPTFKLILDGKSTLVTKTDEESVTNGIHLMSRGVTKKIYFIEGHGEPAIDDKNDPEALGLLADALRHQNYEIDTLFLPSVDAVPSDASVVIAASADKAYFPHELEVLSRYMRNGGRVMFMLEPRKNTEVVTFLADWGVNVGNDVVIDRQVRLFEGMTLGLDLVVSDYSDHPAVAAFSQRTIFSLARSVIPSAEPAEGLFTAPLLVTAKTTWAETDLDALFDEGEAAQADDELAGPVPLATAVSAFAEKIGGQGDDEFQMVVFGDTTFVTNRYLRQLFNDALVLSVVGWLAGQDELISIGPRAVRASRAHLSVEEGRTVFYLSVLVLPELILLCGVLVWWRRSAL